MARLASMAGVRIQTIGVGTVAGTTVEIGGSASPRRWIRQTLQGHRQGHERVVPPSRRPGRSSGHLQNDQPPLHAGEASTRRSPPLFAAAAALLLVAGALLSVLWFGRVM